MNTPFSIDDVKDFDFESLSSSPPSVSEDDVIANAKLEHLYNHQFENGRFFQVLFSDSQHVDIKLASKTLMKVVYIKEKDDIEGIELIKVVSGKEKERIKFSKFNFQQLREFLKFIDSIDLKDLDQRRISLSDDSLDTLSPDIKRKINTLLSGDSGIDFIRTFLDEGNITSEDLVNTGYRKKQLIQFQNLLENDCNDEQTWQKFFEENQWIFGYGLGYIFLSNLDGKKLEQTVSGSDINNVGKRVDALMKTKGNISNLCFVEIKTTNTALLDSTPYRRGCWAPSKELTEAIAQIQGTVALAIDNKAKKFELPDAEGNPTGEQIFRYQPKSYLIIGNLSQFKNNLGVNEEKYRSFELYRKNITSPEIITFDELYERAKYIVSHSL